MASTLNRRSSGASVATSQLSRPLAPAGCTPVRSTHVHSSAHGRLSRKPSTVAAAVQAANQAATRHEPPTSSVATAINSPTPANITIVTGTNAAVSASTKPAKATARRRWRRSTGATPSVRSSAEAEGSAVSSPAPRRSRCTSHGSAANQASAPQSPWLSTPGTSGVPT